MKYLIVLIPTFLLSACAMNLDIVGGDRGNYLKDDDGVVPDCYGKFIGKNDDAPKFWQANNLPRGTTDFVCKDYKAYVAKKATDCQGKLLTSYPNGILGFKQINNFPKYDTGQIVLYTNFKCNNGNVIPIDLSKTPNY